MQKLFSGDYILDTEDGDCMVLCNFTGILFPRFVFQADRKAIQVFEGKAGEPEVLILAPEDLASEIKSAFVVEAMEDGRPARMNRVEMVNG